MANGEAVLDRGFRLMGWLAAAVVVVVAGGLLPVVTRLCDLPDLGLGRGEAGGLRVGRPEDRVFCFSACSSGRGKGPLDRREGSAEA